ncbi:RrF2 family transcriptional regulator [Thermodesulfobacterium hveragerdense]|uniref:RrF2 family transcriptional regulator n=1 Tax=Thermodesulfobacterium hveragerdense TaxID=53424 RepID=UPI000412E950|nr:Rrf2 family transcriptional regulator [Thermodesulfobacterium hveragerdense]
MFKLSTKGRYAVRAMYEIAKAYPNGVTLEEISASQNISRVYLAQILNRLRQSRLIKSSRGPGGGYVLRKHPDEVSFYEILELLEGPVCIASCIDLGEGCEDVEECVAYPIWKKIGQYIECLLRQVKLADLLRVETEKDKKKLVETITAGCC